ncbi:hypothetical protein MSP8887_00544 [Marinomonas spartinae]|uniref:hypothetical protein n=1 Tax=Marinomonas spartinae TaxID=1792290 RepID=UPI000808FA79|nr:hypothetical protein [Marinomonas spartinae]SBS27126.1 hypothetical protein MSP8887_00544 [Marinomonas spartinae]
MTQEIYTEVTNNGVTYDVVGEPSTMDEEIEALGANIVGAGVNGLTITDEQVEAIMKKLAIAAVSKIPVVGQVLGPILGFLTEDRRSVWEQVEEQVKREINKRIMEEKIKTMRGINNGLGDGFKNAANYEGQTQYTALISLAGQFDAFRGMFQGMSDSGRDWFETLPFITMLALQDTLVLSLLVKTGKDHDTEKNQQVNQDRFESSKSNYIEYIKLAAQKVLEWRMGEIEVKTQSGGYMQFGAFVTAKDNWTGKKVASGNVPMFPGKDKPKVTQEIEAYKERVRNETIDFLMRTSVGPLEPWGLDRSIFDRNPGSIWEQLLGKAIKAIIENMTKK